MFKILILFSIFASIQTFAEKNIYIDQKDKRFYDLGLIPQGSASSLCGPTSFLNLILSDFQDEGNLKSDDADFLLLKTIENSKEILLQEKINVNKGLLEYELVKYIEQFQKNIQLPKHSESYKLQFKNYGNSFYSESLDAKAFIKKANEPKKQIWFIKLQEIRYNTPYNPKKPINDFDPGFGENEPMRLFHFVTKTKTINQNNFEFIDPENPNEKLVMELKIEIDSATKKEVRLLKALSPNAFKNFWLRPPYRVELISIIGN